MGETKICVLRHSVALCQVWQLILIVNMVGVRDTQALKAPFWVYLSIVRVFLKMIGMHETKLKGEVAWIGWHHGRRWRLGRNKRQRETESITARSCALYFLDNTRWAAFFRHALCLTAGLKSVGPADYRPLRQWAKINLSSLQLVCSDILSQNAKLTSTPVLLTEGPDDNVSTC